MSGLRECVDCGCCFEPVPGYGDCCPDCEQDAQQLSEEYEREQRLENALNCQCGAWGFTPGGQVYHAADCVCGRT